jgi:hypothetical protein
MLSGPRALLLPRYLRHRSYVFLSNVFVMEAFVSLLFSKINPFRLCQGYCLTPHTQSRS